MKGFLNTILHVAGFIMATFLMWFCLLFLTSGDGQVILISVLGILGYIGLFLLFLEHRVNHWLIITLLFCGLLSFLFFATKGDMWSEIRMDNLHLWVLYMLPSIVALINILKLLKNKFLKRNAL